MKKPTRDSRSELPELSAEQLDATNGGIWNFVGGMFGRWLGGEAAGGFGNIPNDQEEAAMAGYPNGWPDAWGYSDDWGYGGP